MWHFEYSIGPVITKAGVVVGFSEGPLMCFNDFDGKRIWEVPTEHQLRQLSVADGKLYTAEGTVVTERDSKSGRMLRRWDANAVVRGGLASGSLWAVQGVCRSSESAAREPRAVKIADHIDAEASRAPDAGELPGGPVTHMAILEPNDLYWQIVESTTARSRCDLVCWNLGDSTLFWTLPLAEVFDRPVGYDVVLTPIDDQLVLVGGGWGRAMASVTLTGNVLWSRDVFKSNKAYRAVIPAAGAVLAIGDDDSVSLIDPKSGRDIQSIRPFACRIRFADVVENCILATLEDGRVYCITAHRSPGNRE
jgi:outer membrane protein assembly factor BamB